MRETAIINSRKYDGSIRRSWQCELIEREEPQLVFLGVFESEVEHENLGTISRGTASYEYYWLDRWFNVFRFHEPDGSVRNYYCNVNMPPIYSSGVLDYVDLDIDVVIWPDGSYVVLDLDEYEANASNYGYPDEVRAGALDALAHLERLINANQFPGSLI